MHPGPEAQARVRQAGPRTRAVTQGLQIYLGAGEWPLALHPAQPVLAHEVAHAAQQAAGRRGGDLGTVPAAEAEADALARGGQAAPVRVAMAPATPLHLDGDERTESRANRSRAIGRSLAGDAGRGRYLQPPGERLRRGEDVPLAMDRAETEALLQENIAALRPTIPEWFDAEGMGTFDSDFYGAPGPFDFRGRPMAGWEVNYYFVSMAMAHQGWDWNETQAIIWSWNMSQEWGVNPWGGGGDMTDEMWFASQQGWVDEIARMALEAP